MYVMCTFTMYVHVCVCVCVCAAMILYAYGDETVFWQGSKAVNLFSIQTTY